jgi:pimeloyl-ACP methyl ester carboxylesterase
MPDFTHNHITLHYQVSGQGPALILIGGMGMPLQGWAMQVNALSKAHRVIRMDNRGCGRSTTPDTPYTTRDMAGDVLALMDHLEVGTAHVMGASMGGFIALELALAAPGRVSSLVLAHTAPAVPPLTRQRIRLWLGLMDEGVSDRLMAMEQLVWVFPEKAMENETAVKALLKNLRMGKNNQSAQGFRGQALACEAFDITGRLGEIQAQVLLISSRDDIAIPLAHTRKLEVLPGFRKTKIFDVGGHATHLIHADAFNRSVLDFLSSLSG